MKLERMQQNFAALFFYKLLFPHVHYSYANASYNLKMHNLLDRGITITHCFY